MKTLQAVPHNEKPPTEHTSTVFYQLPPATIHFFPWPKHNNNLSNNKSISQQS